MKISHIKVGELARICNVNKPVVSRYFKSVDEGVTRVNNRITGIHPDMAHQFLFDHGVTYFDQGGVVLSANLCGGVGKTTSVTSLSAAMRRVTKEDSPIVIIDTDPQGSFTESVFGSPADDSERILIDYLEGKASIENILTDIGHNMFFIKSNLNQIYVDKVLSKPGDIKKGMLRLYEELFDRLGSKLKIFQDHTPWLSSLFASSVCALPQLKSDIVRSIIIPLRSDKFAVSGGDKTIKEIEELQEVFNLPSNIDIHFFFSAVDRRVSTTGQAIKTASSKKKIINNLSPIIIRYSSEIPKSIEKSTNIYSPGKKNSNKSAEDYQDLLEYIFRFNREEAEVA